MGKRVYTIDKELDKWELGKLKENANGNKMRYDIAVGLNKLLRDRNKTQDWLSSVSDISPGSISAYCKAKSEPTATNILKIANAFDITCDELLRGIRAENIDIHEKTGLSDRQIENLYKLKANSIDWFSKTLDISNELLGSADYYNLIKGINYARFIKIKEKVINEIYEKGSIEFTYKQYQDIATKALVPTSPAESYRSRIRTLEEQFGKLVEAIVNKTLDGIEIVELISEEEALSQFFLNLLYDNIDDQFIPNIERLEKSLGIL
ncbi:MAG: helix-turn-helix transcriptional regulator [Parabacteroides sp.]|nr:helix-turn-helix transcriptional regulator [Parabacteroides sp.]